MESLEHLLRDIVRMTVDELREHPLKPETKTMNADEVCEYLRIGRSTMDRKLGNGTFEPAPFFERPYRWRRADVEAYDVNRRLRDTSNAARSKTRRP